MVKLEADGFDGASAIMMQKLILLTTLQQDVNFLCRKKDRYQKLGQKGTKGINAVTKSIIISSNENSSMQLNYQGNSGILSHFTQLNIR